MTTLFLVRADSTGYALKGDKIYLWDTIPYVEVQEYQDGAHPVYSGNFCGYCNSNNCGSLYGDSVCHELPIPK